MTENENESAKSRFALLQQCLVQATNRSLQRSLHSELPRSFASIPEQELQEHLRILEDGLRGSILADFEQIAQQLQLRERLATLDAIATTATEERQQPAPRAQITLDNVRPEEVESATRIQTKLEERDRLLAILAELESERKALTQSLETKKTLLASSPLIKLASKTETQDD